MRLRFLGNECWTKAVPQSERMSGRPDPLRMEPRAARRRSIREKRG